MRIALAGNPNSGKTTMYNAITGRNEKVGNWAGVTVDRNEHTIRHTLSAGRDDLIAVDLPGAYSMSPFTSEESVTRDYIKNESPDALVNIVDATNLSRSLFFTTQLLELGIPMVVALNKTDANEKRQNKINASLLSEKLGCPVIETVSTSSRGLKEVISAVLSVAGTEQTAPYREGELDLTDRAAVNAADRKRYEFVDSITRAVETRSVHTRERNFGDKIDDILTNKWLGLPIFGVVMFLVFMLSQWEFGPGVLIANLFTGLLESGQEALASAIGSDTVWTSMLIDGIIGGFIAIVGFLPLVMVMYFLIALLEDCGYMARATVVLDPIFKRVGLSGKSVIPFIIGTGCSIPGVMACRTIRDERERVATAMLAPFMPCGAKLPVIALFAGVFFSDSAWVGATMYFIGILIILLSAMLVNALTGNKRRKSFFIIELPEYKAPSFPKALKSMCQRGWSFVVKAGTIILVCNFVIHLMQNFTWNLMPASNASESILAMVATPFAYLFAPIIGFVSWQFAAAAITGFIAKENVVGTLAVCFGITNFFSDEQMLDGSAGLVASSLGITSVAALAFLMFVLFSPPCFAAIGAMNSEIKNKKWFFAGIALELSVGYSLGFLVYFFGTLFTGAHFQNTWTSVMGWIIFALIVFAYAFFVWKNQRKRHTNNQASKEEAVSHEAVGTV